MTNSITPPERDIDVAISFLNQDLELAVDIGNRLATSLNTFIYTARQEELAGTDGLQSFRDAFRSRSRLVVILHRGGWGSTPWTRVEEQAITDRFLKEGPEFLFAIMLDDSAPPPWLPDKLIRFKLKDFGIEQAVGAIKARALELGSVVARPSLAALASQAQKKVEFAKHRDALFHSDAGVRQVDASAASLMELLCDRAAEARDAAPDLKIEFGASRTSFVIRIPSVAVACGYLNRIANVLDQARLFVRDLRGAVILPTETGFYYRVEPTELAQTIYRPELSRAQGWGWKLEDTDEFVTGEELAESCITRFLSLVDQQSAGELPDIPFD